MKMRTIQLERCRIVETEFGSTIYYPDGTESSNWPHDTDFYNWVVEACGHTCPKKYCFEHEFCHVFLPEFLFGTDSHIVWQNAHKLDINEMASHWEERLIFYFQQYLNDVIDLSFDPQMVAAKNQARELLREY